ncbi:EAL and HDOD domain-containing protein [Marinospirillum celere]|uniref:EAL and HDOD domain-containing protein n=1 Tax=Marinospirillum celere TaxID=1122252 RepID=UPI0015A68D16|nr:HDOD domain-containing protein [Marinospirillum celere]
MADELLYRSSYHSKSSHFSDPMQATARALNAAIHEIGLDRLIGDRTLFFNAPREWLRRPELLPEHKDQLVIEIQNDARVDSSFLSEIKEIKQQGFAIALDHFELSDATRPLLEVADIIKIDMITNIPEQLDLEVFKEYKVKLLAERVEDLLTFNRCKELGFHFFQGFFFSKPESIVETGRKRGGNRTAEVRILAELQKEEPDYEQLERLLAQDPHLCVLLLRYTNSAMNRGREEITSISQALKRLGVDRMSSIVTTLMLASNGPCSRLVMLLTLTRASMCENLAKGMELDPRSAFMVGMLSKVDVLMGERLSTLLEKLPLDKQLVAALMKREGPYGKLLRLVEAFEKGSLANKSPKLTKRLNDIYLYSRTWSSELLDQAA